MSRSMRWLMSVELVVDGLVALFRRSVSCLLKECRMMLESVGSMSSDDGRNKEFTRGSDS
jgi:hypothetical protein